MKDFSKAVTILKHCIVKHGKPTKAIVLVTDACNSHCIHCNVWQKVPTTDLLTVEDYQRVFSDPFLSDVNEIIISGGEPMVHKDIKEIVLTLHKCLPNAEITLGTNGLLPYKTALIVREILETGMNKLTVGTSLDYIGPVHDDIRGTPGAYHKVTQLISHLKRIHEDFPCLKIGFGAVLQEKNQDNIKEIIQYAKDNDLYYLIQWMSDAKYYQHPKSKHSTKEREIVSNLPDFMGMLKEIWINKLDGKDISFNCYALRDWFIILCNGDVVPCLHLCEYRMGNIRNESISYILRDKRDLEYNNLNVQWIYKKVESCKGCLNSWATMWSAEAHGFPYLKYYLKHPIELWSKLK